MSEVRINAESLVCETRTNGKVLLNKVRINAETLLYKGQPGCRKLEEVADALLWPTRCMCLHREATWFGKICVSPAYNLKFPGRPAQLFDRIALCPTAKESVPLKGRISLYKKGQEIICDSKNSDSTWKYVVKTAAVGVGLLFFGLFATVLFIPGVICKQIAVSLNQTSKKSQEVVRSVLVSTQTWEDV